MSIRLSLRHKVLLFVAVPLLIQIGLLVALANLQTSAEMALKASTRSRMISDTINQIASDILKIVTRYRTYEALENLPLDDTTGVALFSRLHSDYQSLKELAADQPDILNAVIRSENTTNEYISMFALIKNALQDAQAIRQIDRIRIARKFRNRNNDALVKQLLLIGEEQKRIADRAPEEQAVFREKAQAVMIVLGFFDLVLGIALCLFLTRNITDRLERIMDNTFRLAGGLALNPQLKGSDELARLDQVFHKMAEELQVAMRKERAVVQNANDFICTLDSQFKILAANPAVTNLLGFEPDNLIGKNVLDLICEADRERAGICLNALRKIPAVAPEEFVLQTSSGSLITTLWSSHWSHEESSFFCVVHDITERKKVENLKQEVTAMVTHDLRSPLSTLNNVLNFFEATIDEPKNEKVHKYIGMGRRNTERMLTLVNDLLDTEKIRSGSMEIDMVPFGLQNCFDKCHELTAAFAEEVKVELSFESTDIRVLGDESMIDRVLSNLVSNAIKYSPTGKNVRIFACRDKHTATITVQDDGPGIPQEDLDSVFERFRQVRRPGAKTKGGSGLGLTICKAIVELHGGKIWVESDGHTNGNGKEKSPGSSFVFTLALAPDLA
ncbi:MAG TPA: ATP-binding protein [Candidatus Melainabacteria bacterium]|nr:ATP-binding protein [Candidatus Melainabacteria bacterium]